MFSTWMSSTAGLRRVFTGLALTFAALVVSAAPVFAQEAAAPSTRTLTGDAGVIYYLVKADKVADFEGVIAKVKEALAKSEEAGRKEQAAGWKMYKQIEAGPNGNVVYVGVVGQAVKDVDYNLLPLLYAVFPAEAQTLYEQYRDALAGGVSNVNYQLVSDFSK